MPEIQHQVTRKYAKGPATTYPLPHDEEERWRLNLQNNLLLRATGNKALHAPVTLTDDDWVLETASGTGIWLQDLAKETPSKPQYIGTDIEPSLFPDPSTLPPNMKFETHSILKLPSHWTNKFTVSHERLGLPNLRSSELPQAIDEMYRVLKPGGWVQLFEITHWESGPALVKFYEMLYGLGDEQGMRWRDLTSQLPTFLEQSGFINIHQNTFTTPLGDWGGQDGVEGKENLLSGLRGFKTPMLKGGGYGVVKSEAEYDELLEQIREEIDNTPGSHSLWVMLFAQKPQAIEPTHLD